MRNWSRNKGVKTRKTRKRGADKNWPKPALRGSTRRMTKVEPRGISFNIFATCNNIVQNIQNMQQYRSEYAEYATKSFRICNNIVQNMQQYRSEYATIWFRMVQNCGFVLNYLFLLNVFTHSSRSPIWVFVVNEERLQRLLSFQKDIIHQNRQLLLCNKLIFIWNINVCHHIKVPSYSLQMSHNKITS